MPKSKKEDETTKKSSVTKSKKTATKTAAKKTATKKTATKKTATKKTAAKTAVKKTAPKTAIKTAAKKSATKTSVKKTATKTAANKTATKTTVKKTAKKTPEKKTPAKKTESKAINKVVEISDDGFNWTEFEEGIQTISKKQIDEFDKLIDENFVDTYTESVIVGTVVNITEREAIIDINAKSEGVISLNEFRYNPDLKIGDSVEVIVDIQEDKTGQLVLSHRKARTIKAWERVIEAHEKETVVTGFVKCRTKGGMIVDVFGLEAFLPGSQIDVKPIRDYDQYVNKNMEFRIVKINHEFKNVVVSHKALIEADIEEQKKEIISQLKKGQVLEGIVKNITTYGVFVDLGGVDGLIHITDLSWNRINHPTEILELDQKLNVVILDFDDDKSRIQLGVKQLSKHPWENLDSNLKEGDKVKGKVSVLADYGAFIEIEAGIDGPVHDRVSLRYGLMHDLLNDLHRSDYSLQDAEKFKPLSITNIGSKSVQVPFGRFEAIGVQHQAEGSSRVTTLWCVGELGFLPVIIEQHRKGKLQFQAMLTNYAPLTGEEVTKSK